MLSFINLSIPEPFTSENTKTESFNILSFLITYPFYSACLVKVLYPDQPFKPEYVIPQLLLQYVKNENYLDGIIYSSTKDKTKTDNKHHNIVIPSRKIANNGHCFDLKKWFYSSDVQKIDISNIIQNEIKLSSLPTSEID